MNKPIDLPLLIQRPAEPAPTLAAPRRRTWVVASVPLACAWIIVTVLLLASLFAPWIAPYDPAAISLGHALEPPSSEHWFGTDAIGRDQLSRALHGGRVSLAIAAASVLLAAVFGTLLGVVAGFSGRHVDALIMRLVDIQLALPTVVLALMLAGAIGASIVNLVLVLAMANWARFARVIRSETLSLKQREFVLLSRLGGASPLRIMLAHIVPNLIGPIVVLITLDLGVVIVLESTLSFLGLGIQPPTPSWGSMIADGRAYLERAWWLCVPPGLVLIATVLAVNLIGDDLRDRLSPALAQRW